MFGDTAPTESSPILVVGGGRGEEEGGRRDGCDRDQPVYDFPAREWTGDVYGIEQ